VPGLAGALVPAAAVVGAAGAGLELELLQPAARTVAATAAKPARPSLLNLRTVVPPGG
jgi:hypothetical protein